MRADRGGWTMRYERRYSEGMGKWGALSVAGVLVGLACGCGGRSEDTPIQLGALSGGVNGVDGGEEVAGDGGTVAAGGTLGGGAGASHSGDAGASVGGAGGDENAAAIADVVQQWPSTGCGLPLPPNQVPTVPGSREGYTKFTVMQTGETITGNDPTKAVPRDIFVRVPADYDLNRAYPVVYIGIGCGGSAEQTSYPLFDQSKGGDEQAIYVAVGLPPNEPNSVCYDNRAGEGSQEWEAFELFHTLIDATYCADNNRIFVSGYSTGGWLANMWGCYFAGLPDPPRKFAPQFRIRGQAALSGSQPENVPECNGPVAGIWLHSPENQVTPIAGAQAGRDRALLMNDCVGSSTEPWGEGEITTLMCEQYIDCPPEYPVIFCESVSIGNQSDSVNYAIPGFTQFFNLMKYAPR